MLPESSRDRYAVVAIALLVVLTFLYSVLIAGRPLLLISIAVPLVFLYLAWRFVRAVERIATALEDGSDVRVER